MKPGKPVSLERILQSQGFGSRRVCRDLIEAGRVAVDGIVRWDAGASLVPTPAVLLTVDDATWPWRETLYLALHKPAGFECSRQPQHHRAVFSLLPDHFVTRGVQSAGRLDADTTGLLLLSDDGPWLHAQASPKRHVPKTYHVTTKHPVAEALVRALLAGVQLHDEPAPLAALQCHAIDGHQLALTIDQGKYHQVKRMVAAAGNRVEALRRVAVGGLVLGEGSLAGLKEGEWCELTATDLAVLAGS
jgi:16S rRNA pseudouridine516 synthase